MLEVKKNNALHIGTQGLTIHIQRNRPDIQFFCSIPLNKPVFGSFILGIHSLECILLKIVYLVKY